MKNFQDDADSYDFEVPKEIKSWIEFQREQGRGTSRINLGHYVLENGKIKKASLLQWARWFENIENRRVDYTQISQDFYVSTVFIGLDYNFNPDNDKPILYETCILGGPKKYNGKTWRYHNLGEAKKGHWQIVDALTKGQKPNPEGEPSVFNFLDDLFDEDDEN